jgi:signal transduction histidine kinase
MTRPSGATGGFHWVGEAADRIIVMLSRRRPGPWARYGAGVTLVLFSAAARAVLPVPAIPYLLFVPTLFIVGLVYGLGVGLVATGLSAFLAAWLFLGTPFNFYLNMSEWVTTGLYVLFGIFICVVCDAARRAASAQEMELRRYRTLKSEADATALALRRLNETLEHRVLERTAQLENAQEALRQAQKMEALGQLTGGIAHDFNTLLAAILGNLELSQTRVAQGRFEAVERYLSAAQGATARAATLTGRLLAFARRQTLAPRPTDINRLVADMEELIRRTVGPGVAVTVNFQEDLWPTLVDPHQLENALLNLCINARDAMPQGGRLTIGTANVAGESRTADACVGGAGSGAEDGSLGDHVLLRVRDTGVGMAPEVKARAFEPFFTTKSLGQGTGLGLSMIYGFALQSGGRVEIESAVGEGALVLLRLPRHRGEATVPEAPAALVDLAAPPRRPATVMVIDDEAAVRALVVEVLSAAGHVVLEAHDGPTALDRLRSAGRVDLLITDLGLPGGMNGRQAAAAACAAWPSLKVLYITGYADIAPRGDDAADPDAPLLAKPFTLEALIAKVRQVLA